MCAGIKVEYIHPSARDIPGNLPMSMPRTTTEHQDPAGGRSAVPEAARAGYTGPGEGPWRARDGGGAWPGDGGIVRARRARRPLTPARRLHPPPGYPTCALCPCMLPSDGCCPPPDNALPVPRASDCRACEHLRPTPEPSPAPPVASTRPPAPRSPTRSTPTPPMIARPPLPPAMTMTRCRHLRSPPSLRTTWLTTSRMPTAAVGLVGAVIGRRGHAGGRRAPRLVASHGRYRSLPCRSGSWSRA